MRPAEDTRQQLRWTTIEDDPALPGLALGDRVTYPEFRDIEFLHVAAKSLINHVPAASGMPFEWTINVYRGCTHACSYCFARPTHGYLDLDAGRDFERVIVVKVNAVERLRAELARPSWGGHHIAMGTNTDPYQRCEGRYRLTRGVVETLTEAGNPFSVLTKGTLALRDLDLFAVAAQRCGASVSYSIPTLDEDVWRSSEPGTPHPRKRMDAVAALNAAGVPSGVMLAPILPGISDDPGMIEQVVRAAIEAGATHLTPISLHLRPGVRDLYLSWLGREHPGLVATYRQMYRSSYLSKQQRGELHALVRTLVRRHAPPSHPLRRPRPPRGATRAGTRTLQDPPAEQLGLAI